MSDELTQWLLGESESLCRETLYRAPNMLPDEVDLAEFLEQVAPTLGAARSERMSAVQTWAAAAVGSDALLADDWLTMLRVLNEEVGGRLAAQFPADKALVHWREVSQLLSMAQIEAAKLTGSAAQADLLEHTVELRENLERLEKSKSNFVTVGAHELRTPLTIVEGYANMLRVETPADSPVQIYLHGMDNGLLRMKEIVADMIDVSLIDLHSFELSYQRLNVEQVLRMVTDNLQVHFSQRAVQLVTDRFKQPAYTYGDPQMLVKALDKVLMNGLKYTPDGGSVRISAKPARLDEVYANVSGYVQLQVKDSGIGIAPENLVRIFDKFAGISDASLHSSSKTAFKGGGAGLGLAIAKGIIEAHGGSIWAESPGFDDRAFPGSTFYIELPIYLSPPVSVDDGDLG